MTSVGRGAGHQSVLEAVQADARSLRAGRVQVHSAAPAATDARRLSDVESVEVLLSTWTSRRPPPGDLQPTHRQGQLLIIRAN